MLTIQQAGIEILQNRPRKLYIFGGSEYGIKSKYLDTMKQHYGDQHEVANFATIIDMMSHKQLVPLKPALYVVRYDDAFISELSPTTAKKLLSLNIIGTLVGIYEQNAHVNKCEKYLPDNTVSIDAVDTRFIVKYLQADYPELSVNMLQFIANAAINYGHARQIAADVNAIRKSKLLQSITAPQMQKLFGIDTKYTEDAIKLAIASRNFNAVMSVIAEYSNNLDNILYTILATLVELEKLHCNTYTQSPLRPYVKTWTRKDIYNMFNHTYDALQKLRSVTSDNENILLYLISLLQFSEIPSLEVMA